MSALPDWGGLVVAVAGGGVTGWSVVRALQPLGARITVLDEREGPVTLPPDAALVITSPGWRPDHPLLVGAVAAGVPVWGDVELAWRLSTQPGADAGAPWLVVTGTNGKTSTTGMLAGVLAAAGLDAPACGNIGLPVLDAALATPRPDALAVELSSFQLHWAPSVVATAGAVLNVAEDHLDWHGSTAAYAAAKARALGGPDSVAIAVRDDPGARALLAAAPGRRVGITAGPPAPGEMGLVRDPAGGSPLLVDRALSPGAPAEADLLCALADLPWARAAHDVTNALTAAALARSIGVPADAVAAGLGGFTPGAHRGALVAEAGGVRWVDDSKATNPHAALASITAHPRGSVVWLAGGLGKGVSFADLARDAGPWLRAAVLLGTCAGDIAEALARHAPAIPVTRVASLDDGVRVAAGLARAGDTVLLAPAAASMDMFRDYADRGERFVAAVETTVGDSRQEQV